MNLAYLCTTTIVTSVLPDKSRMAKVLLAHAISVSLRVSSAKHAFPDTRSAGPSCDLPALQ
jgi:hypothetical protein